MNLPHLSSGNKKITSGDYLGGISDYLTLAKSTSNLGRIAIENIQRILRLPNDVAATNLILTRLDQMINLIKNRQDFIARFKYSNIDVLRFATRCIVLKNKKSEEDQSLNEWLQKASYLSKASHISREQGFDACFSYAITTFPDRSLQLIHLLYANHAARGKNFNDWLKSINAYLQHYDTPAITLKTSNKNILSRIQGKEHPSTESTNDQQQPLVTVILAYYNASATLDYAITSILNQTHKNIELIIVDDCSTDQSIVIINKYLAQDKRIKFLRNSTNVGPYVSRNIATSQASGSWITCHDADDWAHPNRISEQLHLCQSQNYSACLAGILRISSEGEFVRFHNPAGKYSHDGALRLGLVTLFIRSDVYHKLLGGWDSVRSAGDSELIQRYTHFFKKKPLSLNKPLAFCLDNPDGITNSALLYFRDGEGLSPIRKRYAELYQAWHRSLSSNPINFQGRLNLSKDREFPAPLEIQVPNNQIRSLLHEYAKQDIHPRGKVLADTIIITNLRFPGGNASSTLDEARWLTSNNQSILIIHCPTDKDLKKNISTRYKEQEASIRYFEEIEDIEANQVIIRNPSVASSAAFKKLAPKINSKKIFIVFNNSHKKITGDIVYDMGEITRNAINCNTSQIIFCPISRVIRREMLMNSSVAVEKGVRISSYDWHPTFDFSLYFNEVKQTTRLPIRIGRHGRDSTEKWPDTSEKIVQAYPKSDDVRVLILGGASCIEKAVGSIPENWEVIDFGGVSVKDYLSALDVFIYFPHSELQEAFGRSVAEALISGLPVIVPHRFIETFGELVIPADEESVADIIGRLRDLSTVERTRWLQEIQEIAIENFGGDVINMRLQDCGTDWKEESKTISLTISEKARSIRSKVISG